jgi:hypothetical protein
MSFKFNTSKKDEIILYNSIMQWVIDTNEYIINFSIL